MFEKSPILKMFRKCGAALGGSRGETPVNRALRTSAGLVVAFTVTWALGVRTHALASAAEWGSAPRHFPSMHEMLAMSDADYAAVCRADGLRHPDNFVRRRAQIQDRD